jgi:teichuronic acid exporter
MSKLFKSILFFSFFKYLSFTVGILGQILLVRLLLPSDFSEYVMAIALIEIVFLFSSLGLNNAVLKYQYESEVFGTGLCVSIVLGFLFFLISLLLYVILPYEDDIKNIFIVLAISKLLSFPMSIYNAFLEKDFKQFKIGSIELFSKLTGFMLAIYLIKYNDFRVEALVVKDSLSVLLQFFLIFIFTFKKVKFGFDVKLAKMFFNFSYKVLILRFTEVSNKQLPILFLGSALNSQVSFFERSHYLIGLPNTFFSPLNAKISYAFYSKYQNEVKKVFKAMEINIYVTFRMLLPISILSFLYPKDIILIVYGEGWLEMVDFFKALSFTILFLPMFSIIKFYFVYKGEFMKLVLIRSLAVIILLLNILLIHFGFVKEFYSLGYSFTLGYFLSVIYVFFYVYKINAFNFYFLFLLPFIYFVFGFILSFSVSGFILKMVIILSLYFIFILIFERKMLISIKANVLRGSGEANA